MSENEVPPNEAGQHIPGSKTDGPLDGRVLDERFLLERRLSGDGCENYLAKDLKNFCDDVILRILPAPGPDTPAPGSFHDISSALIKLGHPNVEPIRETGTLLGGRTFAVMTYAGTMPVGDLLTHGRRLKLDQTAHIVEAVGSALGAAHSRKILHCGVSPSNIWVTRDLTADILVANFGIDWPPVPGRPTVSLAGPKSGSFFYTSPELMTEGGRATPASDIYSLAAVAWTMLTGDVPFRAGEREHLLQLIAQGRPARPSELRTDLPPEAEGLLLSALQYKPLMRPRDIRNFGRDLAASLRGSAEYFRNARRVAPPVRAVRVPVPDVQPEAVTQIEKAPVLPPAKPPAPVSDRWIPWSLIVLLLAGALSIPIGQTILSEQKPPVANSIPVAKPVITKVPREIKYSIDTPALKDTASSGPLQYSFTASGEFGLTFETDAPGNAYVFGEFADAQDNTVFSLIYPTDRVNGGSSAVMPKQQVKTRPASCKDCKALWLVWTAEPHADLEEIGRMALAADGVVRGENDLQRLKHFLERNKNNRLSTRIDETGQQTVLNGSGDRIVHRIELERK